MNREQAQELAQKITRTWSGGPKLEIWAEDLEELHFGQAQSTYFQLRKSEDSAPSIHRFHAHYASLTRDDDTAKVQCERCDGGGWALQEPTVHHPQCAGADRCHCSAVLPCHCTAGRAMQAVHGRIVGAKGPF